MRTSQLLRRIKVCSVACLPLVATAQAATKTWMGSVTGNWSVAGNWTGGVPGNGDTAVIATDLSNSLPFTVTYDVDGSGLTLNELDLSADTSGDTIAAATLSISATTLIATTENIGGYVTQSNGSPRHGLGVIA